MNSDFIGISLSSAIIFLLLANVCFSQSRDEILQNGQAIPHVVVSSRRAELYCL